MGSFFSTVWSHVLAVFTNWWWIVTAILFVADKALEWVWPHYRDWLKETFSEETRRKWLWRTLFVFVFISEFLAWKEEYTKHLASQRKLAEAQGEIVLLKAQPRIGEEVQAQIADLTQTNQQLQQKVETLQRQQRQSIPRQIVKRSEFLSALREAGPVMLNIACIASDRDAADLYANLHDLLLSGGWVIKDKMWVNGTPWRGVRVTIKDRNAPPTGAVLMVELLQQNGIAGYLVETSALALDMFSVEIGYKP